MAKYWVTIEENLQPEIPLIDKFWWRVGEEGSASSSVGYGYARSEKSARKKINKAISKFEARKSKIEFIIER
jgi:hypothetical protein